ncbi:MAG TPA: DUF1553 domain-containing protein, partial [Pirellulales bacterium]|nr:DUF1553 domain-containing protein [Pirellulales bacterium]
KGSVSELRRPYEDRLLEAKLAGVPEPIRADTKLAIQSAPENRNEVLKYLADKFGKMLKVSPEEVSAALSPEDKASWDKFDAEIAALNSGRRSWGTIQAVYDVGPPPATYLLRRGDLDRPGAQVPPGYLRVLCDSAEQSTIADAEASAITSGRRLAFARWLTQPDSTAGGLVSRVYVNRVWQALFGQGIVATSDNFGNSGARPTHPELLDWLAVEFQSNGWRIKPLVKQIMLSSVYRQASRRESPSTASAGPHRATAEPESVDPGNELLWHMPLRQQESECVRDAILCASGQLQQGLGGPPTPLDGRADGAVMVKKDATASAAARRSMYLVSRRRYNLSLLEAFDQPELTSNCTRRTSSAVVSQSLTLLNDDFVLEQARAFASRIEREAENTNDRIVRAFQIALSRKPLPSETSWAHELLDHQAERYLKTAPPPEAAHQALSHLCQMLFNTSEFLYIP